MKQDIGGKWNLLFFEETGIYPISPEDLANISYQEIEATVPGNVELDLSRHGILSDDLFFGDNILKLRKYELYQWWYSREFSTPEWSGDSEAELVFEGLDTFAKIWINGVLVGEASNSMITHTFSVGHTLKKDGSSNLIQIQLRSPIYAAKAFPLTADVSGGMYRNESLWVRKPAHCYGWDIMPRALSAGIWRPVYLRRKKRTEITDVFLSTIKVTEDKAIIKFQMDFQTEHPLRNFRVQVAGQCGGSSFSANQSVFFTHCSFNICVENPMLWWPAGYGDANLYQINVKLFHEEKLVSEASTNLGIREIHLDRTDVNTPDHPGRFEFIANGVKIFCKGTNWVPADAFHSRDAERIPRIFDLIQEMDCNIIRCWGGNVYETHQFYDLCDKYGIMVWQDFSMACAVYPQQPDFLESIREEAVSIVKLLRQHPSLVLLSGDNEVDSGIVHGNINDDFKRDPSSNKITREVLPEVVRMYHPTVSYLPSSPYYSRTAFQLFPHGEQDYMSLSELIPEGHYYPHGKYYKEDAEYLNKPVLMSELGCLGCPGLSSLKRFIPKEHLFIPDPEDPVWRLHSTEPVPEFSTGYRVAHYNSQVEKFFGKMPDSLDDYVIASQIAQAEGLKYMVELFRIRKGEASGVIWWNIMDGWAQMSDALVDYYFQKKLVFYYLKRTHSSVSVMIQEKENVLKVIAVNDSLKEQKGTFKITDADSGKCVLQNFFTLEKNGKTECGSFSSPVSGNHLFLIEWECEGKRGCNHYLYGSPAFSFRHYKEKWLPAIAALDGTFSAEIIGQ